MSETKFQHLLSTHDKNWKEVTPIGDVDSPTSRSASSPNFLATRFYTSIFNESSYLHLSESIRKRRNHGYLAKQNSRSGVLRILPPLMSVASTRCFWFLGRYLQLQSVARTLQRTHTSKFHHITFRQNL